MTDSTLLDPSISHSHVVRQLLLRNVQRSLEDLRASVRNDDVEQTQQLARRIEAAMATAGATMLAHCAHRLSDCTSAGERDDVMDVLESAARVTCVMLQTVDSQRAAT